MFTDPLQLLAIAVISIIFITSLLGVGKKQGFLAQFAAIAPNTLTSMGIFFTFIGILIKHSSCHPTLC
jgi:hypothetical protein